MVIRTAWLYSIYGNNFVKTMIRLGRERESFGVIFDQIGTPTYANDLALAILQPLIKVLSVVSITLAMREFVLGTTLQ